MIKYPLFYLLFSFLLIFFSCTKEKVDFSLIEEAITQNSLEKAERLLNIIDTTQLDSINLKKWKQRSRRISLYSWEKRLQKYANANKGGALEAELQQFNIFLNKGDKVTQKFAAFYWHKYNALFYALNGDSVHWAQELEKAVSFPVFNMGHKQELQFKLAFFHAEQGAYDKGRIWLDKTLRTIYIATEDSLYQSVYLHYTNGRFNEALSILSSDSGSTLQWKMVQEFLEKYGNKLTLKHRYRLW